MVRIFPPLIASTLLLAAWPALASAQQPVTDSAPQQGVLLLRNGQTIEGKIVRVGEHYRVVLPNGNIRMRAADVELCCGSLEEGYWRKRGVMRVGDVFAHLDLAQWCLSNGLLGHAGKELADAADADPTHPMIGVLRRRLQLALNPPPPPPPPPPPVAKSESTSPSTEDLDRLVREMPAGTVETFTRTIQPLLANTCIASGCHGPRDQSSFRLQSISSSQPNRRTTQRNLYATLQWVDRQQPLASRLLLAPLAPHGTADSAVITARQAEQWKRVALWICQVASQSETPNSTAVRSQDSDSRSSAAVDGASGNPPLGNPGPADAAPTAAPERGRAGDVVPSGFTADTNIFAEADRMRKPAVQRGAQWKQFVPADAFDPEIFNRRFFPERYQTPRQ